MAGMLARLISADWSPFRATMLDGMPVVFDARLVGIQPTKYAVDTLEGAERIAQWLNDDARGGEAHRLLPEWENLRDLQTHALVDQRCGWNDGKRWASPLASTYRNLARTCEELGRIWDAIATAENSRAALDDFAVKS